MAEPAKEFIPSPRSKDCTKKPGGWGVPMSDYEYIWYGNKGEDDYPEEACLPYYHKSAQIDGLQINNPGITGTGDIIISGEVVASEVTASGITLTSRKPFDIPHPTKEGYRLRHVCLEGPESGVYYRGRLLNTNKIIFVLRRRIRIPQFLYIKCQKKYRFFLYFFNVVNIYN